MNKQKTVLIASLSQEIQREYDKLINLIASIPVSSRILKQIEGTGGKVSITDHVAYQIGWGKCLIGWYESGIKGEVPIMPGGVLNMGLYCYCSAFLPKIPISPL